MLLLNIAGSAMIQIMDHIHISSWFRVTLAYNYILLVSIFNSTLNVIPNILACPQDVLKNSETKLSFEDSKLNQIASLLKLSLTIL